MSGSIFRRGGQKAEVHGAPGEQETSTALLEARLADLQTAWSAPLIAYVPVHTINGHGTRRLRFPAEHSYRSTQSLAVWQKANQAVEVTIERGHVLQRMGEHTSCLSMPCCA